MLLQLPQDKLLHLRSIVGLGMLPDMVNMCSTFAVCRIQDIRTEGLVGTPSPCCATYRVRSE
jgi:hypothetical protein